jgi:hypothetical protein
MPLREIRLGREKTLSGLANRLFVFDGPNAAEQRRRAERALLKANPMLARAEGFKPGRTVVVPMVPGLTLKDTEMTRRVSLADGLDDAAGQLRIGAARLATDIEAARGEAEKQLARLADRELRKLARATIPDSEARFEKAQSGVKKRLEVKEGQGKNTLRAMEAAAGKMAEIGQKLRRRD